VANLLFTYLLGELRHGKRPVLLAASRSERREADHEEVEAREGDHVDRELAEVAVELPGEPEGARGSRESGGDEVVEVACSERERKRERERE